MNTKYDALEVSPLKVLPDNVKERCLPSEVLPNLVKLVSDLVLVEERQS